MNILITGGCGFIGINFVIELLKNPKNNVTIIDKMSYLSVANHFFLKKNFTSRIKIYKNSIKYSIEPKPRRYFETTNI